ASENGEDMAAVEAAVEEVTGESLAEVVDPEVVAAALDPVESVAQRDSLGGPAPEAVRDALVDVVAGIEADEESVAEREAALAEAERALAAEVASYA
ncbi:MAG: argininosuccinate lyase, partial [Halobacterium sp.]